MAIENESLIRTAWTRYCRGAHGTRGHDFDKHGPLRLPTPHHLPDEPLTLPPAEKPMTELRERIVIITRERGRYDGMPATRYVGRLEGNSTEVVLDMEVKNMTPLLQTRDAESPQKSPHPTLDAQKPK